MNNFNQETQIALIWSIEDVQDLRPDLDDRDAMSVLRRVKHTHDCDIGVSWLTLQITADEMFPREK